MNADKRGFMSEEIKKHPLNVKDKYYVDYDTCLNHCCFDIALNNFKMDEDCIAYIFKQPETTEEEERCLESKMCCPVEAIYGDGDE